jgi:addiction module HigA family antidote
MLTSWLSSSTTERKATMMATKRTKTKATKVLAVRQPLKREPTHPGEILREDVLPALRLNVSQAARELGVSRQLLHGILAGRAPVTPEMAVRPGKWAGNGPALWLGVQQAFDVWHAEQALGAELERIPGHAA